MVNMKENRKSTKGREKSLAVRTRKWRKKIGTKKIAAGRDDRNVFPRISGYLYPRENDRKKKGGQRKSKCPQKPDHDDEDKERERERDREIYTHTLTYIIAIVSL